MSIQLNRALFKSFLSITAIILLTNPVLGDESESEIKPLKPNAVATPTFVPAPPAVQPPNQYQAPSAPHQPGGKWQPGETRYVPVQMGHPVNPQPRQNAAWDQQTAQLFGQLLKNNQPILTPIENGKLHVFQLKHVSPTFLTETLETFLGKDKLRIVNEMGTETLLVYSSDEVAEQINEVVNALDTDPAPPSNQPADIQPTQSLRLRIFWLAEGDPMDRNTDPEEFLPEAVINAVKTLGLQTQKLVAQSTTSLVVGHGDDNSEGFQFQFPATTDEEMFTLQCQGEITLDNQPRLDLQISIDTPTSPLELSGIITAPLDHFMVLGTTHYAPQHDYTTRFAFVVQVIEAQSFAPEE